MDSATPASSVSLQDTLPYMNPADMRAALRVLIQAYQAEVDTLKAAKQQLQHQLCFYYGKTGHRVYLCTEKPTTAKVKTRTLSCKVSLPVCLSVSDSCFYATAPP